MNTHIPATADGTPISELPEYSVHQLALRNGQDRDEIWFAYHGLIYDVTRSRLWSRGHHYEHWAGQDLTAELDQDAPHTVNVLDKFYVVGRLKAAPPKP
ncbi:cytochrome b5 domain-containing protein [Hymenobacter oligotrophus]|uniref:cytochrome b5 domain-containing protein n=1 Tax=Hymenobacter oligotrophus TaxID=2319843 RepID=UPI001F091002|nr:cytochrome b5 domain-containing protein [Hymenobacter oligotrophus]